MHSLSVVEAISEAAVNTVFKHHKDRRIVKAEITWNITLKRRLYHKLLYFKE